MDGILDPYRPIPIKGFYFDSLRSVLIYSDSVLTPRDLVILKKIDSLKNQIDTPKPILSFSDFFMGIFAPLLVGLITFFVTTIWNRKKAKKKIDDAPRKYVEELDKLITRGVNEGQENAVLNARAIVAARDSLRSSLSSISSQLNSQIDVLASDIGIEYIQNLNKVSSAPFDSKSENQKAYETILVLSRVWPSRKVQIEIEVRRILAEMGLEFSSFM
ncbi:hypothetical protein [Limnovirga soli]|uniref:Uncharacterized protein n=1 Tax=Limnovirga soli TaxID=2656915 RepID=A0A8J8FLT6_9BACT|nr:hypothetical protein [Limnovirga soli]NNV57204.1 hypothetical protein [Limnovirga soli]